jgi:Skp family chaperone for outer membrane proteins
MKKFLLAALMTSSVVLADKVAIVDLYKVLRNLPDFEKVEVEMQKETSVAQSKLNNKKLQLDAKIQELETNKDTISDQKMQKIRREITTLQRELKYLESDLREDLGLKEQDQKNMLVNRAIMAVSDYSKKEKIDIVFSSEQVVYQSSQKDITDAVIKSLPASSKEKDSK